MKTDTLAVLKRLKQRMQADIDGFQYVFAAKTTTPQSRRMFKMREGAIRDCMGLVAAEIAKLKSKGRKKR